MATAMGVLKWSPSEFWKATMMDFTTALKGHLSTVGIDTRPGVTAEEFREEVERYEQEKKALDVADQ